MERLRTEREGSEHERKGSEPNEKARNGMEDQGFGRLGMERLGRVGMEELGMVGTERIGSDQVVTGKTIHPCIVV